MCCVIFEKRTEFLSIISMILDFKGLTEYKNVKFNR
jgi:hypothetical protein